AIGRERPGRRRRPAKRAGRALVIGARAVGHAVIDVGGDAPAVVVAAHGAPRSAIVRQFRGDGRSHIERPCRPGAAGEFPLGLARQTIVAPGEFGQAPAEVVRLVPGDALDRQAVAFEERGERPEGRKRSCPGGLIATAAHWACVTGPAPMKNGLTVTWRCGPSFARRAPRKRQERGALRAPAVHTRRSTIIFLMRMIALAGFRPLGQVWEQFMIVWQR